MDDPAVRALFFADPENFLANYPGKVIFDEAQKTPELFDYIKIIVDEHRADYGRFILSGSSQFSLLSNVTESLAGRAGMLTLLPFERSEVPPDKQKQLIFEGAYPELVMRDFKLSDKWYRSYIKTYISRDVKDIKDIGNTRDFNRCLKLLAHRAGQTLNIAGLASDLGVSQPTVRSWISVLEASYIIFLLPPFYKNYGKRVVKSPKIYFYDTGLLSYLNGIQRGNIAKNPEMAGHIFENYIISECNKIIEHADLDLQMYHYRTSHGVEIDLILDDGATQTFIEIKSSMTFKSEYIKNMRKICDDVSKYVVYQGDTMTRGEELNVLNFNDFLLERLSRIE